MTSMFWAELSNDYEKLFETEIGYDVIIYAGEEQNIKEIHAHSSILCIRSQYFHSAFSNKWVEKKDGNFIFRKPNISPQLFNIILRFIYCGNIELKNLQVSDILKLLIAVDELNIQPLISYIQEFLIKHKTEFLHQDPTGILETIYQHEIFTDLRNFCLERICENVESLFGSDKFINLKAPLLELLLKSDLYIDEIKIWENLLEWCLSQHNIKNDSASWSKEDITKIEKSLRRFIPLIRFYDIKPKDFFYKIYCYKDVLPQGLIHDLLEFHIVPNTKPKTNLTPSRKPKLNSTLIEPNHIPLFTSWIDKKYYNNNTVPYDLKLLHRSSRDGFNAASFHRNCDNKGATIWMAKIQGSTQLIGGYNPLDWGGNCGWKDTANSFLFNFTDGKKTSTAKLGYICNTKHAVYCHNSSGPHMGNFYCTNSKNWSYNIHGDDYPTNIGIPENITVEEYEVFEVVKRQI